jgi:hypothetical protein
LGGNPGTVWEIEEEKGGIICQKLYGQAPSGSGEKCPPLSGALNTVAMQGRSSLLGFTVAGYRERMFLRLNGFRAGKGMNDYQFSSYNGLDSFIVGLAEEIQERVRIRPSVRFKRSCKLQKRSLFEPLQILMRTIRHFHEIPDQPCVEEVILILRRADSTSAPLNQNFASNNTGSLPIWHRINGGLH